jgi:serine-type D-Ala-D-Ala carboxypeptidase/endopeptidase (penicillin-binding protein 4)
MDNPAAHPLAGQVGKQDAILLSDCSNNKILFSKNAQKKLIPASILKLVISLAALHYLGEEFRFVTEFYYTDNGDLIIKGYGDPGFISAEIERAAQTISQKIHTVRHIVVDDSFFAPAITIPGRTPISMEPYDAPNGALCANYNSIALGLQEGVYISAEPETPLLPFAVQQLQGLPTTTGRVLLIQEQGETALYAGELLAYFLGQSGSLVTGDVRPGRADTNIKTPVLRQASVFSLSEVIAQLLQYSNNFTANQLLLYCGAKRFGPPATLAKGVLAVQDYAATVLNINDMNLVEGSGLSRQNRISAEFMNRVLSAFLPYRNLMRKDGDEFYKTGHLQGVSTRAGYLKRTDDSMMAYVIIVNTPGKTATDFMPNIKKLTNSFPPAENQ